MRYHGLIGVVTILLEEQLVKPKTKGRLRVKPCRIGRHSVYTEEDKSKAVRFTNIPSYLAYESLDIEHPVLGKLTIDISYGELLCYC